MDNVETVQTVLDFTGFNIVDGTGNIRGNGAGLRVRHQALRTQDTTQTSDNAHHIGSCDDSVEIEPVSPAGSSEPYPLRQRNPRRLLLLPCLVALGKNKNANGLAGTMRQNDSATDLLVSMTAINAQTYMDFYGLIKLGRRDIDNSLKRLSRAVKGLLVVLFSQLPDTSYLFSSC